MTIGCVILAGGKSSRMGTDKALLETNGKKFIEQIAEELDFFEEKFIARGNKHKIDEVTWPLIPDIYQECGPVGGLHAALSHCRSDALFCVTCDMPLIKKNLFQLLYEAMENDDDVVIAMTDDGRKHPLCGIYRKSVASVLEKQIKSGNYRVMAALDTMRVKCVSVRMEAESQQLFNVNTPEHYLELKEM